MSMPTMTKARPAGVQAQQSGSVALPPAEIYPARGRLSAKLSESERASADLEEYKARAERARIDEDRAMEDEHLSESEAAEQISKAQNERNVYASRQGQREKALGILSAELAKMIYEASAELRGLINAEESRREEILSARILEALQVGKAINPRGITTEIAGLLQYSTLIQAIRALAPSTAVVQPGNIEGLAAIARDILRKFEGVIKETGKSI